MRRFGRSSPGLAESVESNSSHDHGAKVDASSAGAIDACLTTADHDEEEEQMCRYCFEGPEVDKLISPCHCAGGQKWVHLKCLRMWQRAVLVSQPTHPDFYDSDTRQRICNVCKSEFTCAPPTRAELLASFTGPELAALIDEGCFIGSAENFSRELERQVSPFPVPMREGIVSLNWVRGLFLIVKVVEDRNRGTVLLKVDDEEEMNLFLRQVQADARTFHLRGRRFSILPQGPLKNLSQSDSPEVRRELIRSVRTPATIRLRPDYSDDCGEDGIVAVNLSRPLDLAALNRNMLRARQRAAFRAAEQSVLCEREQSELSVQISHFVGGPCEEEKVAACIIVTENNYIVVQEEACLEAALSSAEELAALTSEERNEGGSATAAVGMVSESTLGQPAAAAPKRRRLAPEAGEAQAAAGPVRVFVYWGYAGWSRCQLMGEIARGSWGLCKANPEDVVSRTPSQVWQEVYPRLVFAPHSEMSESYTSEAPEEEERRTQLRRMAAIHDLVTGRAEDSTSAEDGARPEGEEESSTGPESVTSEEEPSADSEVIQTPDAVNAAH